MKRIALAVAVGPFFWALGFLIVGCGADDSAMFPAGEPEPNFPSMGYSEGYNYAPSGMIVGVSTGTEVRNGGGPGQVLVAVVCPDRDWRSSKVFYIAEGETVTVTARFGVVTSSMNCEFEWTTRAALPGDISAGEMEVERH